jgi:hypothetical protein
MGCINNLSAIASYNGNQPLENNVNLVWNESGSSYYMHQAIPLGATISEDMLTLFPGSSCLAISETCCSDVTEFVSDCTKFII